MSSSATALLTIGTVTCKLHHSLPSSFVFLAVGSFPIDLHIMPLSPHLNACCPQEWHHHHRLFSCCFTHCSCHNAGLYFSGQARPASERKAHAGRDITIPRLFKKLKICWGCCTLSKRKKDALSAFLQLPFSFSGGFGFPEGSWTTQGCSHSVEHRGG